MASNTGPDPEDVRQRIGRLLKGWAKYGGAMEVIRSHLASAQRRKNATIIADITLMTKRFDTRELDECDAAWPAVG